MVSRKSESTRLSFKLSLCDTCAPIHPRLLVIRVSRMDGGRNFILCVCSFWNVGESISCENQLPVFVLVWGVILLTTIAKPFCATEGLMSSVFATRCWFSNRPIGSRDIELPFPIQLRAGAFDNCKEWCYIIPRCHAFRTWTKFTFQKLHSHREGWPPFSTMVSY